MRYQLPEHWTVRYDYHEHPRGISAVVIDQFGSVQGVGVAKFNPADAQFKASTGKSIALGRALARAARGIGPARADQGLDREPRFWTPLSRKPSRAELEAIGASFAMELVRTD